MSGTIHDKFIAVTGLAHKGNRFIHGLHCRQRRAKASPCMATQLRRPTHTPDLKLNDGSCKSFCRMPSLQLCANV